MAIETLPAIEVRPAEPTTPIKPSEAIRLGCLVAPVQAFDTYFGFQDDACVIGAAALGWGGGPVYAEARFREALGDSLPCPEASCTEHKAWPSILNDEHHWSRERIADWLESQGL